MTKDLIIQVHERLNLPVKQAYGLSETSPVTHIQGWDDSWKTHIGSVGPCLPNLATKYLDSEDREFTSSKGKEGELCISGPTIFRGYHKNDSATAACKTADGKWFKTGDVGYEDAEGNMYITDRVKELIKYKGSQVAPAELEGLLLSHPAVEDVAVVGRWVENMHTEVPVAFVVLKKGVRHAGEMWAKEEVARGLVEWMARKTARSKWLRGGVVWAEEVPKSGSGKILRRVLKEELKVRGLTFYGERLYENAKI